MEPGFSPGGWFYRLSSAAVLIVGFHVQPHPLALIPFVPSEEQI
jgi:hypothetical protein